MVILSAIDHFARGFFMTIQVLFYPSVVLVLLAFILLTIPRAALRTLVPLGLVLGGLVDTICNFICGNLLRIYSFTSPGILDASGHLILAPLAWSLVIIAFLYFWPSKKFEPLTYFYILAWGLLATGFSQVVDFLELFDYSDWLYPLPMLILFLVRFSLAAWVAKPWTNSWV